LAGWSRWATQFIEPLEHACQYLTHRHDNTALPFARLILLCAQLNKCHVKMP
jgi:hypothetical protein